MPREYRHIKMYEEEIFELRSQGLTQRQIAENFFSILKTECIYRTKLQTYEEACLLIAEYIYF